MLKTGITGRASAPVTGENTAEALGSGALPVFATPKMIALMESAAYGSVLPCLGEGEDTVGTLVNVRHLAATPVGMTITAESELIEIDARRLVFAVRAFDERGVVGEGTHERVIIAVSRFLEKAASRAPQ